MKVSSATLARAVGALAGLLAILPRATMPVPTPEAALFGLLTLALELGNFRTAFAPALALALTSGPATAAAVLILAVLLRLPIRGSSTALEELCPGLLGIGAAGLGGPIAGVAGYLLARPRPLALLTAILGVLMATPAALALVPALFWVREPDQRPDRKSALAGARNLVEGAHATAEEQQRERARLQDLLVRTAASSDVRATLSDLQLDTPALQQVAHLALRNEERFQGQIEALGLQARAHARAAEWAQRLAFLLEGELSHGLSPAEIAARLQALLTRTLPHRAGALRHPAITHTWGAEPLPGDALLTLDADLNPDQQTVLELIALQAETALQNASLHQDALRAQAQLVQSSKLAAVGQLAAGVAHELNTPLCSALVAVEMARLNPANRPKVEAHLTLAESNGNRCRDIIGKLLYYARGSDSRDETCDLADVARAALDLLGRQLALDGVRLEARLEPAPVRGNANELQQIVTNLLLNARQAVLDEHATGRGVRVTTGAGGLTVEDQGPGIEPAVLERIFEPFFTTRPLGQGLGLGLSVSREIAARYGGKLEVSSGSGARFVLRLPPG